MPMVARESKKLPGDFVSARLHLTKAEIRQVIYSVMLLSLGVWEEWVTTDALHLKPSVAAVLWLVFAGWVWGHRHSDWCWAWGPVVVLIIGRLLIASESLVFLSRSEIVTAGLSWVCAGWGWRYVSRRRLRYETILLEARYDLLTGLANRRALLSDWRRECGRNARFQRTLALAIIDIDHFKHINDQWGHAVGDLCLQRLARCLEQSLRSYDGIYRMGGDEFVLLMPETDHQGAQQVCQRLQQRIHDEPTSPKFTVCIGVVIVQGTCPPLEWCLDQADRQMYQARRMGKGQFLIADGTAAQPPQDLSSLVPCSRGP
ncbi:MAG: hypothetical protein KatS3mg114_1093 [Planctomycetaceae bacterium]|nr:MAG: hypothetical protein KatS3mg114_1093 [Planctomycetaceae bacterium]